MTGTGNYGYGIVRHTDNRIRFETYGSDGTRDQLYGTSTLIDHNWHYVVGTWDGTINVNGKKIYVDGTLESQKTNTISVMGQPAYQFRMGQDYGSGGKLNGSIDDVRVYNAAIPTSQIKEQYYAGLNSLLADGSITSEEYKERIKIISINDN
jgi:hypothetical protein